MPKIKTTFTGKDYYSESIIQQNARKVVESLTTDEIYRYLDFYLSFLNDPNLAKPENMPQEVKEFFESRFRLTPEVEKQHLRNRLIKRIFYNILRIMQETGRHIDEKTYELLKSNKKTYWVVSPYSLKRSGKSYEDITIEPTIDFKLGQRAKMIQEALAIKTLVFKRMKSIVKSIGREDIEKAPLVSKTNALKALSQTFHILQQHFDEEAHLKDFYDRIIELKKERITTSQDGKQLKEKLTMIIEKNKKSWEKYNKK